MSKISRRDFIKSTAAGALGVAAATMLGGCAKKSEGVYTPGTYTGTATGMGAVKVTATFDESKITKVVLDLAEETDSIGQAAAEELVKQIMEAQSADIDGVSGATVTSKAVANALNDCIAQAKGETAVTVNEGTSEADDNDWLGQAPEIADSNVKETIETDVLVIGLGLAGVAAARSAAEEGAKVVAIEKATAPQCRSGEFAVINGNVQAKWGRNTWTKEQIDDMADFHVTESNYKVKRSIFSKWANNIGEVFDWWVEPNPELYYAPNTRADIPDENKDNFLIPIFYPLPEKYNWMEEKFPCYPTSVEFLPNQGVNFNKNMEAAVATGNVDARYACFAEKLIMEDGRCVGAYIRNNEDNSYFKVIARNGVIMATGDYSQNEAMVKHFCPDVIENNIMRLFTNVDANGVMTNMGDGIKLGMWAGAKVQQCHAPMIHHMGGGADLAGVGVMGIAGFLNLDMNGRRFMNEDLPGQQIENQIELQKNRQTWQIFDSNWPSQLEYMPAEHGGACYFEDITKEEAPKNNATYRNYKSPYQLEEAVADGRCLKADTLEELAGLMYPEDKEAQKTALASIERYNKLAKEGYDADFGKKASRMFALEKGPFYADKFECALLLVICGGLESDEDCHTFDENRNIIPGLYVAGNVQGSRFAAEYPITLKGVSHSMAMYYGYVAGKNAVNKI
ncbi:MAG: FAD-binding protein [Erysipelotrichaceae bacterium]